MHKSSFLIPSSFYSHLPAYEDGTNRVFKKLRHINSRRQGITQKKAYNIQNKAKAWIQENRNMLQQPP